MTGVYESLSLRIGYAKAVLVGAPAYIHVQVNGTLAVASAGRRKKDKQVLHAAIPYHSSKFAYVVPCPAEVLGLISDGQARPPARPPGSCRR
jgi:hypothetical protein